MNIDIAANYAEVIGGVSVIVSLIYVGIQIRNNTMVNQGEELTTAEQVRMIHLMLGMIEQYQVYFILNKLNMIDNESFERFFRKILLVLCTPTARQWFTTNRNFFRQDFVEYVDNLLDENPQVFGALAQFYGLDSSAA